jgi:hypothetical protein
MKALSTQTLISYRTSLIRVLKGLFCLTGVGCLASKLLVTLETLQLILFFNIYGKQKIS